ncbi:hypothetical protein CMI37_09160 [Candidatus Pacearchaeota archaeon]|nr:hypothetical protein [Candidatus Pacearchaeota archaeon]|tara:strand:- start:2337 stop:6386 length:4050 start_codon:yes stop_codon:yes gene_type:complete
MALKIPTKFGNDTKARNTAIFPVIQIEHPDIEGGIWIGTNIPNFGSDWAIPPDWKPILLKIPSIKESIDVESSRRYKVGSLNIQLSNFPYDNQRFSELVGSHSIINAKCRIFWCSQSTTGFNFVDTGESYGPYNGMQVFVGYVRKYDYDDEKVKIVLEDNTEAIMSQDLPTAKLGAGIDVPENYKSKPIPIVYGTVENSPCVIKKSTESDTLFDVIAESSTFTANGGIKDTTEILIGGNNFKKYSLFIYKDQYLPVNEEFYQGDDSLMWAFGQHDPNLGSYQRGLRNYTRNADRNKFSIISSEETADNYLTSWHIPERTLDVKPHILNEQMGNNDDDLRFYDSNYPQGSASNGWNGVDHLAEINWNLASNDSIQDDYVQIHGISYGSTDGEGEGHAALEFHFPGISSSITGSDDSGIPLTHTFLLMKVTVEDLPGDKNGFMRGSHKVTLVDTNNPYTSLYREDIDNYSSSLNRFDIPMQNFSADFDGSIVPEKVHSPVYYFSIPKLDDGLDNDINIKFHELHVWQTIKIKDIHKQKYFAHVIGRVGAVATIPYIIQDIMNVELKQEEVLPTGEYTDWRYDFTIHKSISAKRLIEEITSSSPYVARYNSMGDFTLTTIKNSYNVSDLNDANGTKIPNTTILSDDVISYTFLRTPIKDVKTRVEFRFNFDYGLGDYIKEIDHYGVNNLSVKHLALDQADIESFYSYYSLPVDDSKSTLVIDGSEGKYIKDKDTAHAFALWKLMWHCNQHLKVKSLRLPLKYMNLEPGDIVEFEEHLDEDFLPYGIEYKKGSVYTLNGQTIYPYFMITSKKLTLEYCQFDLIQMHQLGYGTSVCGGVLEIDACGYCGGNGCYEQNCSLYPPDEYDCWGNCTGSLDACGFCGGDCVDIGNGEVSCPGTYPNWCACPVDGVEQFIDVCGTCGGFQTDTDDCECPMDSLCNWPECNMLVGCDGVCGSGASYGGGAEISCDPNACCGGSGPDCPQMEIGCMVCGGEQPSTCWDGSYDCPDSPCPEAPDDNLTSIIFYPDTAMDQGLHYLSLMNSWAEAMAGDSETFELYDVSATANDPSIVIKTGLGSYYDPDPYIDSFVMDQTMARIYFERIQTDDSMANCNNEFFDLTFFMAEIRLIDTANNAIYPNVTLDERFFEHQNDYGTYKTGVMASYSLFDTGDEENWNTGEIQTAFNPAYVYLDIQWPPSEDRLTLFKLCGEDECVHPDGTVLSEYECSLGWGCREFEIEIKISWGMGCQENPDYIYDFFASTKRISVQPRPCCMNADVSGNGSLDPLDWVLYDQHCWGSDENNENIMTSDDCFSLVGENGTMCGCAGDIAPPYGLITHMDTQWMACILFDTCDDGDE